MVDYAGKVEAGFARRPASSLACSELVGLTHLSSTVGSKQQLRGSRTSAGFSRPGYPSKMLHGPGVRCQDSKESEGSALDAEFPDLGLVVQSVKAGQVKAPFR